MILNPPPPQRKTVKLFEISGWAVSIDKKLMTETKRILAWAQCRFQSGRFEKGSPGWLGWAAVCLLNQPGRSGAVVSMPTTGWAGLRCSTCPQHLPECSCHRSWEATTPTEKKKNRSGGARWRHVDRQVIKNNKLNATILSFCQGSHMSMLHSQKSSYCLTPNIQR